MNGYKKKLMSIVGSFISFLKIRKFLMLNSFFFFKDRMFEEFQT